MSDNPGPYSQRISQRARAVLTAAIQNWPRAETYSCPREFSSAEQNRINETLPRMLGALFNAGVDDESSLIKQTELPDIDAFLSSAAEACLVGSVHGWLFNMGIGGSECLPSWRLLAQISPLLECAQRLERAGFGLPRIQFFKANSLAHLINKRDRDKLATSSVGTLVFIDRYIADRFPVMHSKLELENDHPISVQKLVDEVVRPIASSIPIDPHIERLSRARSSPVDGMIYGLTHAFQLQHVVGKEKTDRLLWSSERDNGIPKAVVTFGGMPERLFEDVINAAVVGAPIDRFQKVPRVRVITRLCRKPSYLPLAQETTIERVPSLKELRLQSALPEIAGDWDYVKKLHGFDLAIASGSGAAPFARLAAAVQLASQAA